MKQFRHGDVIIQQVQALPDHSEPIPRLILAHGELTGHAHKVVPANGAKLFRSEQGWLSAYEKITDPARR